MPIDALHIALMSALGVFAGLLIACGVGAGPSPAQPE